MPRKTAFTIRAIDELFRQLRYAPPRTRKRQMNAAERLIHEIDPDRNYPESFIIYRITGYRPESAEEESTLVGAALVPDLANLVLRLSEALDLPARDGQRSAMTMDEVAAKLNVASKSVQRYRRKGLVVHSVVFPDGSRKLGCYSDALERFIARHHQTVDRAASFSRVDESLERQMIEEARADHAAQRTSLNAVARRIAKRHGRAHETVRQILMRHDRDAEQPIFAERGPLSDREARMIYRAWRRGVGISQLAERIGRTPATIHRAVNRQRALQLCELDLHYVTLPTFALDDAESVLLSARAVNSGLDRLLPMLDARELLNHAARKDKLDDEDETALIAAYNFLKKRAADGLAELSEWPGARALDEIETSLRWAAAIKRRLVSVTLPVGLGIIEQHVGRRLIELPAEEIRAHIVMTMRTLGRVVDAIDPGKSQRLDRLGRYAVTREMAKLTHPPTVHRAIARHGENAIMLDASRIEMTPWSSLLELPRRLAEHVDRLTNPEREIVVRHYGLDGRSPLTCVAIAQVREITDTSVRRQLGAALAELRHLARGKSSLP